MHSFYYSRVYQNQPFVSLLKKKLWSFLSYLKKFMALIFRCSFFSVFQLIIKIKSYWYTQIELMKSTRDTEFPYTRSTELSSTRGTELSSTTELWYTRVTELSSTNWLNFRLPNIWLVIYIFAKVCNVLYYILCYYNYPILT